MPSSYIIELLLCTIADLLLIYDFQAVSVSSLSLYVNCFIPTDSLILFGENYVMMQLETSYINSKLKVYNYRNSRGSGGATTRGRGAARPVQQLPGRAGPAVEPALPGADAQVAGPELPL